MEVVIEEIPKTCAIDFIKKHHYSKVIPRITKHFLGVFVSGCLEGVIILGLGVQPYNTIQSIFYQHKMETSDYIEISKMSFSKELNGNKSFGSMVLSHLIKWIKTNTNYHFLYTLADGIAGKCGYVYQASNFFYIGKFKSIVYIDNNTGERIHPKSSKKLLEENAKFENKDKISWLTHAFCKEKNIDLIKGYMFRYIYPLNNPAKKLLYEYDEYINNQYPKDSDLVYEKRVKSGKFERTIKPEFNRDVLNYNYQQN